MHVQSGMFKERIYEFKGLESNGVGVGGEEERQNI